MEARRAVSLSQICPYFKGRCLSYAYPIDKSKRQRLRLRQTLPRRKTAIPAWTRDQQKRLGDTKRDAKAGLSTPSRRTRLTCSNLEDTEMDGCSVCVANLNFDITSMRDAVHVCGDHFPPADVTYSLDRTEVLKRF